jgi:hypothetical protein
LSRPEHALHATFTPTYFGEIRKRSEQCGQYT